MKYGFFDDQNKEYVITTPKTPAPWINYLGTQKFFSLISNTGGGYSFYTDARLRRLTRYRYNGVPADQGGRYFYLKEGETVWSPTWQPVQTELDSYECRHGLGYTTITSSKQEIHTAINFFVPLDYDCEVHHLTLTNTGTQIRKLQLFSFLEFCLWNAYDDMTNFQRNFSTAEVEADGNIIYHKTEYRERRNHYAFYGVNQPIQAFETNREAFLGQFSGFGNPTAVRSGQLANSLTYGGSPIAAHQLDIQLQPGEIREIIFVLGYVENEPAAKWEKPGVINKTKAQQLLARFQSPQAVHLALDALAAYWERLLSVYQIDSPEARLDRMVNIWNPYQCMVTFNLSRSASYFESGIGRGMGFRDSNQDILGFVSMLPERAKERILDLAATQFPDGSAYHQYQPLTKKGNSDLGSGFNDDPLWLLYSVIAYLKETGDLAILTEQVPFNNDPAHASSLIEHLRRSLQYVIANRGPHGLPLIGRADWNDCLNLNCFSVTPDEPFQTCTNMDGKTAESVFIAAMFVDIGSEYIRLCQLLNLEQEAVWIENEVAKMRQAIMEHGYDGEWFLRAYDNQSRKIGSRENDEGKIYIEPQGMCVMAGIGVNDGSARRALDSVKTHLNTAHGIKLLYPAYSQYHLEIGEITSYPPGFKENAGIFCHNNPWIMIAETKLGRPEEAYAYYTETAPAYREEISDLHRLEPYIYAQMIAGDDNPLHGQAKNSWLTGSAAWNYVAVTQYILGIRPDFNGLCIDPCLPASIGQLRITRRFRGVEYRIQITNRQTGTYRLVVDGAEQSAKVIRHQPNRPVVEVICEI